MFKGSRERGRILAVAALSATQFAGCSTSNLYIEFDRMTGTAYPADQTVNNSTVSLESIYEDLWDNVTVAEDTTDIAPLTGPIALNDLKQYHFITDAELDALEAANRAVPVGRVSCGSNCFHYHIYGVVTNHFYEYPYGLRDKGITGRMWTEKAQAFAIFYRNGTVQGDAARYLRAAAHEIGHAHNLHHEDGDGSTTIMNLTGTVGNEFNYTFSTRSMTHWQDHPLWCKLPGYATFGVVNGAHPFHLEPMTVGCP